MAERLAIFSEWAAAHSLFLCLCFGTAVSAVWLVMFCKRLSPAPQCDSSAGDRSYAGRAVCVKLFAAAESFGNPINFRKQPVWCVFFLPAVYFAERSCLAGDSAMYSMSLSCVSFRSLSLHASAASYPDAVKGRSFRDMHRCGGLSERWKSCFIRCF